MKIPSAISRIPVFNICSFHPDTDGRSVKRSFLSPDGAPGVLLQDSFRHGRILLPLHSAGIERIRRKAAGEQVFCKDAGLENARFRKQVLVGAPEGGLPEPDHVKYAHGGHCTMA
jgi:hypothetical protein